jgi:glucokinase
VAGPIDGDLVKMTNRDWSFSVDGLARAHGLADLEVVNDFVALARALPFLRQNELTPIGPTALRTDRTKLALGPGTGLGVAGLLRDKGRWIAVPSEAGHMEFAPIGERESAVFAVLRARFGRVSAETAISGTGLSNLDAALRTLSGTAGTDREAAAIVAAANAGEASALEAVHMLLAMLARFAGDMALTFVARGGVYFAGGVLGHIAGFIAPDDFHARFADKAPYGHLLGDIATVMVNVDDQPALRGCAAIAADRT